MDIVREEVKNRLFGESIGKLKDKDIEIETPTSAANFQEVYQKEEFNGIYKLGISFPNQFFNMNPFIDKRTPISGRDAIEEGIDNFNDWLNKSQAIASIFAPKYSNVLQSASEQIKYTKEVSAHSNASFLTLPEAPSISSTQRAIEQAKAELKKEGIRKKILLHIKMNQDEPTYALKCKLGATKANGFIIEWENARDRWQNLIEIGKYYDSKALRILNNVPRTYQIKSAVLPTAVGFADIISHALIRGGGSKKDKKQKRLMTDFLRKKIEINKAIRFRNDGGLHRYSDLKMAGITTLDCGCEADLSAGSTLDDFIREYNNYPYYATNAHNVPAMYEAIGRIRAHIGKNLDQFFGGMPYSRKVIEEVYHKNPWQSKLVV